MKPTTCLLLIFISLLQLMIPGNTQCTIDSAVKEKIQKYLSGLGCNPSGPTKKLSCISIKNSGRVATCPSGMIVTGCACGYGCGSWNVEGQNTCHCQCSVIDWTTARCCHLE
ncbi:resistin-like beta [Castor canadensis]|uniref:Resistin-like beta n=1 Tax=Castor canadensis TaxID=51338 RepID=A0AC58MGF2_CASCN